MASTRRSVLRLCGGTVAVLSAGCLQFTEELAGSGNVSEQTATPTPTPSAFERKYDRETREWMAGIPVDEVADRRGADSVTVTVGRNNEVGFDPPVVVIQVGTRVTWEAASGDGGHELAAADGAFDSGELVSGPGTIYEHTFDEEGTYRYSCKPHGGAGGKGIIDVETEGTGGN